MRVVAYLVPAAAIIAMQVVLAWHATADRWLATLPAPPAPTGVARVFAHPTPITVTISGAGGQAAWRTTVEELQGSRALWRRMHVADWSGVEESTQRAALDRMLRTYRYVLDQPAVWDRMTSHDWDSIPQPIRIAAYRRMLAYWSGFYRVGRDRGLGAGEVTRALTAIVMSESWFNHRARSRNADGGEDIGLGQASPYARRQLCRLHARDLVDVCLSESDYFNPWAATRFVALWMSLLIDEADGDLDRAIRAYNRGIASAGDRLGLDYGLAVARRQLRFVDNLDAPPAWLQLSRTEAAILADQPATLAPLVRPATMHGPSLSTR